MKRLSLSLIHFYQKHLSPTLVHSLGHSCRFTPTCSEYARDAFEKYSFFPALIMSLKRILRCHPWSPVSYDPVK